MPRFRDWLRRSGSRQSADDHIQQRQIDSLSARAAVHTLLTPRRSPLADTDSHRDAGRPETSYQDWKKALHGLTGQDAVNEVCRLSKAGISIHAVSQNHKTILHYAATLDDLVLARHAIDSGVDVNHQAYLDSPKTRSRPEKTTLGWTALHYATKHDNADLVRLLIQRGTEVWESGPIDLAIRMHRQWTYWAFVQYGLVNGSPSQSNLWLVEYTTQSSSLMAHLQKALLAYFEFKDDSPDTICRSCAAGNSTRMRQNIVAHRGPQTSFNYGFLKRCDICMALMKRPTIFLAPEVRHDAMTSVFDEVKYPYYDEDLHYVLSLRKWLHDETTASDCALILPRYWLLRCLKSHKQCGGQLSTLPSRIVRIEQKAQVLRASLQENPDNTQGIYCTLSYRWTANALTLTSLNLSLFKSSIPIEQLPRTIQNAITMAIALGFQYIWIDALCILQDSREDWLIESARMHEVYLGSSLTISALDQDENGMFFARTPAISRDTFERCRPNGALDDRGWVLQEQILSRRTITWSKSGIAWSCAAMNCSESAPGGKRSVYFATDGRGFTEGAPLQREEDETVFKRWIIGGFYNHEDEKAAYKLWRSTLASYTARQLTQETDRWVAISGLAALLGSRLNDSIVAGLWRKKLPHHLMWSVKRERKRTTTMPWLHDGLAPRSQTLSAPSWSWLSVRNPITYAAFGIKDGGPETLVTDSETKIEIQSIDERRATADSIQYRLTVTGQLRKVHVSTHRGDWTGENIALLFGGGKDELPPSQRPCDCEECIPVSHSQRYLENWRGPLWGGRWNDFRADIPTIDPDKLFCLVVTGNSGLILTPSTQADGCFERVGICYFDYHFYGQPPHSSHCSIQIV